MLKRKRREQRVCGVHIGGETVRLAILTTDEQGIRSLTLDAVDVSSGTDHLESIEAAFKLLSERHAIRRWPLAVVLDGDYCVTRVTTGTPQEVERNLQRLAMRIPRYLSLGPGEKITGGYRHLINNKNEYAVTGVANRRVIESLQQSLRECGLTPTSIEPAMVAVARLLPKVVSNDSPLLLADGSGTQWDVGIVQAGRLLLDYRPSAARESERFGETLCGHMSRLHRFCQRHRHLSGSGLGEVYIYGPANKVRTTAKTFENQSALTIQLLTVEALLPGWQLPDDAFDSCWVGAVAAARTFDSSNVELQVADLLTSVRVAKQKSFGHHLLWTVSPVLSVAAIILGLFFGVERYRDLENDFSKVSGTLRGELVNFRARSIAVNEFEERLKVFKAIDGKLERGEYASLLLSQIPQCLPDATKLTRIQLSIDGTIRITGTTLSESIIFDVTSGLRNLPGIADVQLEGTNPRGDVGDPEVDFAIVIRTRNATTIEEV